MKQVVLILSVLFLSLQTYGHSADEAYFRFFVHEELVIVEAEFPWSMRNALLEFQPALENSKLKSDFESALKEYVNENLRLLSSSGDTFKMVSFKEFRESLNSNNGIYVIRFKGRDLSLIQNSILFSIYPHQKNYNILNLGDLKEIYITEIGQESFLIQKKLERSRWFPLVLILPALLVLLGLFQWIILRIKK